MKKPPFLLPLFVFVVAILVLGLSQGTKAQTVTTPIDIPLVTETYTSNGSTYEKLGIWASLGGGTTPQLFEFDTGGTGFYVAYASNSSWWGTNFTGTNMVTHTYSSGNTYVGTQVTTSVSLFTSGSPSSEALQSPSNIAVGQATNIYKSNPSNELWPTNASTPNAPLSTRISTEISGSASPMAAAS